MKNPVSKIILLLGVFVFGLSIANPRAFAQETGDIAGTVTDPTGAVVPDATIAVKNLGTNAVRTVTTNRTGAYVVTGLQPAHYEVTITSPGFHPLSIRVEVTVAARVTLDPKLSVTQETTSVEVTAEGGVQTNTQTQELSQIVNATEVAQMPSLTRNPYDLVALAGNVSAGDSTNSGDSRNPSGGNNQNGFTRGVGFNINGQRSSGTEILLDGVENISVFTDVIGVYIPQDATQEFRVQTSNYEPQYGRASGGIVNVTTKSGTNSYHGVIWEFNRLSSYTSNTVLNAQQGLPKGKYTRNQFGFGVGGPILKDKLFFFGSTEWIRVRSTAIATAAVPTPQFLALTAANTQKFFADYSGGKSFNFTKTYTAGDLGIAGVPADTQAHTASIVRSRTHEVVAPDMVRVCRPEAMSFNTSLSRLNSATNLFSFVFSCSSSFNRFAWPTCRPPYSLRQRNYVCSTISASLHACAVVFPFATATSI